MIIYVERSGIKDSYSFIYFLFYVFVLFVAPIIWVWILKKIRMSNLFQKNAPHPTQKPWDYVFGKREPYWIIVTLKDGTQIAGSYDCNRIDSGCNNENGKHGYQPSKPETQKPGGGNVSGGYQPTSSEGNNPGNKPPPKKP
jgi:hypothetical protein